MSAKAAFGFESMFLEGANHNPNKTGGSPAPAWVFESKQRILSNSTTLQLGSHLAGTSRKLRLGRLRFIFAMSTLNMGAEQEQAHLK